ncbi:hypothetical protein MKW98_005563 [Papaver atlanticum]|uniref:Uncharacterized protein n=1 Tax=Papaver atlanticum TaxID=357466 RepID=A0AAD4SS92_9MAGN|nr:hypothetical protein MKW98_005563 [Papaver atlanticum]
MIALRNPNYTNITKPETTSETSKFDSFTYSYTENKLNLRRKQTKSKEIKVSSAYKSEVKEGSFSAETRSTAYFFLHLITTVIVLL